jgi:hypothetical protein
MYVYVVPNHNRIKNNSETPGERIENHNMKLQQVN